MAKTYKDIQAESERLFGKGASDKKFQWRQQQQRAEGLKEEKRQRGGVAEVWDRNKKVISPVAQLVAGALGGPGAAAALGAAMKGLDREGKGGIGLDLKQAAIGGIQGYGMGQLGAAGKQFIGNKLAERAAMGAGKGMVAPMIDTPLPKAVADMGAGVSRALPPMPAPGATGQLANVANANVINQPLSMSERLMRGAQGAGSYIAKKPEVAGMALKEFNTSRQATANRALEREGMAQAQRQFDETLGLRKRDEEREVERQRRIAQMLAPLFQQISGGQR
jgi:hypothetical protein